MGANMPPFFLPNTVRRRLLQVFFLSLSATTLADCFNPAAPNMAAVARSIESLTGAICKRA